ncbi:UNVERIFIED_CONTAM: hypothetical protein PYX00_002287 [Menopon gallinae]|uniref:FLYWCH-type domain-containing protein n=1 Tax=Menopon gallinae TaxID=328185 RepID=A0AAW2IHU2_9NEOP
MDKTYWNCERKKSECRARAISRSGETKVIFSVVNHNHLPPNMEKKNNGHFLDYSNSSSGDGKSVIFVTGGLGASSTSFFCPTNDSQEKVALCTR